MTEGCEKMSFLDLLMATLTEHERQLSEIADRLEEVCTRLERIARQVEKA